jgi:kumamolisin
VSGTSTFNAVEYFTPTDLGLIDGLTLPTAWIFHPNPAVTHGQGSGRAVPDVSADADPYSGYLLYAPSFAQEEAPELEGGWGGTSFVAPQMNGATAVIDSYLGRRVGLWNPQIYPFAAGHGSPFTPLQQAGTSNDNLYYTGQPGAVYNEATGLGYPNLTRLAADFGVR